MMCDECGIRPAQFHLTTISGEEKTERNLCPCLLYTSEIANIAKDYTDSLYRTLGHITCICDRDAVVSATGGAKRELIEKPLSAEVENILQSRQMSVLNLSAGARMIPVTSDDNAGAYTAQLIAPILADGEIIGGLMLLSRDSGASMGEVDQKVAETTTSIIARQMEQ